MAELYPDKTPEQLAWELSNRLESCELRSKKLVEALKEWINLNIHFATEEMWLDAIEQSKQALADFEGETN